MSSSNLDRIAAPAPASRTQTRQLNLWGFSRLPDGGPFRMAWVHEHFVRGGLDRLNLIVRTEVKNGKPRTRAKPEGEKTKKSDRRTGASGPQTASLNVENVTSPAEPAHGSLSAAFDNDVALSMIPTTNLQPRAPVQPLMPNIKFQAQYPPTISPSSSVAPEHPVLRSKFSVPTKNQLSLENSVTTNLAQLPLPLPPSLGDGTTLFHPQRVSPPPAPAAARDEDDILFFMSSIFGSDQGVQPLCDLSYSSLNEIADDFLNPISF